MKRTIIRIDGALCIGCGACVNRCKQDALQLVDGKAVLVNDDYCDGLGNCIGECPVGAIILEERKVGRSGNEPAANHNVGRSGDEPPTPREVGPAEGSPACGCPGTVARETGRLEPSCERPPRECSQPSELRRFPVQLHLVNPRAEFLKDADLLLAADCTAFACGEFHSRFLRGRMLAIACPKLDHNTQIYVDKLVGMIDDARINTLTVLMMEVPCCIGLARMALAARERAHRNVPVKVVVLSVGGDTLSEEWI